MSNYDSERRRWEAAENAKRKKEEAVFQKEQLIKKTLSKFDYLVIVILIFNLALAIDYFAPKKVTEDELLKIDDLYYREPMFGGSGGFPYTKLIFLNQELLMARSVPFPVVYGIPAKISTTFILSIKTGVEITHEGEKYLFDNLDNFYSNARHLIWIIFLVMALYQFVFTVPDHKLSFALLLLALSLFEVVAFIRYI